MTTFGKKLAECRKAKNLSQKELAEIFNTSHTTIGKYERDEMTPSIEAAKKLAKILDASVGYLLDETEQSNLFRDKKMLQRLQDIANLPDKEKESLLTTIDHFIKASKLSLI
ncbi:MAG: helix-turn-helix transcriptional regulator [Cyclobacteriaceae bacterium]|nr:helix-turn-helix transcriptional regulator [Cyclobacteriaceae bacterium]